MYKNIARAMAAAMAAGIILLGSGCAQQENEVFKLRVEAKEAKGAADRAEASAKSADEAANRAMRTANEAMNAANAAQACCAANTEKIDRAAKKAMSN
jgi:hypothetical protein